MSEEKAKELLKAAMGDEGDMVHCFEVNGYSGEIPRGNDAKRIELIRLAVAEIEQPVCKTCGGSKQIPANEDRNSGHIPDKDVIAVIPCPDCPKSEPTEFQSETVNVVAENIVEKLSSMSKQELEEEVFGYTILVANWKDKIEKQSKLIDQQAAEIKRLMKAINYLQNCLEHIEKKFLPRRFRKEALNERNKTLEQYLPASPKK